MAAAGGEGSWGSGRIVSSEEDTVGKGQNLASKASIMGEFMTFLWERKLWWMIPMFFIFFGIGLLLVFAQGSALAPFIYTLF